MLLDCAARWKFENEQGFWDETNEAYKGLDRQTDRHLLLKALAHYSRPLVRKHPEYAAVLCRQDARDAWCTYLAIWLEEAEG